VGGVSPAYDNNGNLTFDGTVTYCYDVEVRLTRAITAGTCASPTATLGAYAFDAQGRRKSKTAGGTTTITVTDADNREVLEYDGSSGAIQRWYAYGMGSNDVLGQMNVAAGTRITLVPDIQGSFIASMASSATTFSKAAFLPYGENSASTSGTFRYTGSRIDPEIVAASQPSALYYMRARAYSPQWGRFVQVDPIGYQGGINLYAYTGNDPLNGVDPNGTATLQVGVSGNIGVPFTPIGIPVGLGIAIDTHGNVGIYGFGGASAQVGADADAGLSIQVSNADTISDLTGPFFNVSAHGGIGLGGSVDYFTGSSANGPVAGGGVTLGAALGASVSGGATNTWLYAPFGDGSAPSKASK